MSTRLPIPCFPVLHRGELLYSALARQAYQLQYPDGRFQLLETFGPRASVSTIDLPNSLDFLVAGLNPRYGHSADQLIADHTTFPFYAPFLQPEQAAGVQAAMRSEDGRGIHALAGIVPSVVPLPPALRYCPDCAAEDRRERGEALWYRLHQIAGVEVCPIHRAWLELGSARSNHAGGRYRYVVAEESIPAGPARPVAEADRDGEDLLAIARDTAWLLEQHDLPSDIAALHRRHRLLLDDAGLLTTGGSIRQGRLREGFIARFGALLTRLGCPLEAHIKEQWLARLARKPDEALHPLLHLLLMRFLGVDAPTFFDLPTDGERQPFEVGPYPCLNHASDHYGQPTIARPVIAVSSAPAIHRSAISSAPSVASAIRVPGPIRPSRTVSESAGASASARSGWPPWIGNGPMPR